MITREHVKLYKKYNADGDSFVRYGKSKEKKILAYSDWKLMEELLQDLILIKKGLTSNSFNENVLKRLNENCDNLETVNEFKTFAENLKK